MMIQDEDPGSKWERRGAYIDEARIGLFQPIWGVGESGSSRGSCCGCGKVVW